MMWVLSLCLDYSLLNPIFIHSFYGIMTNVASRNIGQNPPIISKLILTEKQ